MRQLLCSWTTPMAHYRRHWGIYPFVALLLISLLACGPATTPEPTGQAGQTPTTQPTPIPTEQPTPTPQMVEEPAPVESVAIEVTGADPVTADLVLVTGLPNGCFSFGGYDLEREGDTFQVTVTNVRPDDPTLACTMVYGLQTTRIALTGDIAVCDTYTVVVNGESHSVQAMIPDKPCGDALMLEEPAPIESVAIEVTTGKPVQANLIVVSGLPNACYSFGRYAISREGDTFDVQVINLVPDDPNQACAEIYRTVSIKVPLEGEVQPCQTYTVNINGQSYQVQAIAPNVRCSETAGSTTEEVTLGVGETVSIGEEGLQLTFLEVTEDSRCPSDVVCIQAGQATASIKVEMNGQELGTLALTIGGGTGSGPQTLDGYTFELTRLDPYPVSTATTQPGDYVAHVTVTTGS